MRIALMTFMDYINTIVTDTKLPWFVQITTDITKYDDNYKFRQVLVLQSVMIITNCTSPNSAADCLIFHYVCYQAISEIVAQ